MKEHKKLTEIKEHKRPTKGFLRIINRFRSWVKDYFICPHCGQTTELGFGFKLESAPSIKNNYEQAGYVRICSYTEEEIPPREIAHHFSNLNVRSNKKEVSNHED